MLRFGTLHLICLIWLIAVHSAHADVEDAETDLTYLRCDGASFELRTTRADGSVFAQHLTVTLKTGVSRVVALPVLSVHQVDLAGPAKALNRSITQWGCRRTGTATFLEALYKCNDYISDRNVAKYCAQSGEWLSYIDLEGHIMDAGYRPDDPRYRSIERKLGVPTAADEEPRMEPVAPIN